MEEQTQKRKKRTLWHRLLGDLLKLLLAPVGITVYIEQPLMSEPPRVDILLLKRELTTWTVEQLQRLPDGLRSRLARHLILEFKYTEVARFYKPQELLSGLPLEEIKAYLQKIETNQKTQQN